MILNTDDYMYITELHAHTHPASDCSEISVSDFVNIHKELGYNSVVITNHFGPLLYDKFKTKEECLNFYIKDYHEAKELGKKIGINIILGAELRFKENFNDYLIYGIDEEFLADAFDYIPYTAEKFYKEMKTENNILFQAHPFRDGMKRSPFVDGIEGYNMHPGHNNRNGLSCQYAADNRLPIICGSDFHHYGFQGVSALLSKEVITDSFSLARILKSRDYLLKIGSSIIIPNDIKEQ